MNLADYNIPIIFGVSFIMIVWLNSDIVQTIAKLTNSNKLFKLDKYIEYKATTDPLCSYPNFLYSEHPSLITKLLSCVICLCFWTTLISLTLLLYVLGYPLDYVIVLFPINYVCSLLLYLLVNRLS